ncbi:MAG: MerR family transcriptional regulator [Pseudomonadota bacterium]
MRNPTHLTIGKLAEGAGVNVETIRYYERRGLIGAQHRAPSGYRLYGADAARRLRFIRRAQQLGFSLSEILGLLSLRVRADATCADVRSQARQKIAVIDAKIDDLRRIRDALERLAASCRGRGPVNECPILENLESE